MATVSTCVLVVEWANQNGCRKCLCCQGKSHLPPASLGCSPRSANGLTQVPFKLVHLFWDSEYVSFCAHPLRVDSLFPTALWLSCMQAWLAFKGLIFLLNPLPPKTGEINVELRLLAPWGEPLQLWLSCHLRVTYPGYWSWLYHVFAPLTYLIVILSLYLELWKVFSVSLQVILIDSFSVNSCNFGVLVGGSELRVFLLFHLDHAFLGKNFM